MWESPIKVSGGVPELSLCMLHHAWIRKRMHSISFCIHGITYICKAMYHVVVASRLTKMHIYDVTVFPP